MLLVLVFISTQNFSQSIDFNFIPEIGDIRNVKTIQSLQAIDPGPTGLNNIWDFSQMNLDSITETNYEYVESSQIDTSEIFKDSDLAVTWGEDPVNATFFQQVGSWMFLMGNRFGSSYSRFNPPMSLFLFPMSYQEELITSGTTNFYFSGDTILNYHEFERRLDGVGTLITPDGQYEDCLRVREIYRTSAIPIFDNAIVTTRYIWYYGKISNTMAIVTENSSAGSSSYRFSWQDNVNDLVSSNSNPFFDSMQLNYLSNGLFELKGEKGKHLFQVYGMDGKKYFENQAEVYTDHYLIKIAKSEMPTNELALLIVMNEETGVYRVLKFYP